MNSKKKSKLSKIFSFRYFFYDFVKWTGALPTLLFVRPSVRYMNKKRYKKVRGGFIVSANHHGFLDPLLALCAIPFRRILFVAMEGLFNTPVKNWFFTHIHCLKVDRENVGADFMRKASDILRDDKGLLIFPEGKISEEIGATAFKPGCAMMSVINNVPIIPMYLCERKSLLRCTKIIIGDPIYPSDVVGESRSLDAIAKLNNYLYEKECELLAESEKINK